MRSNQAQIRANKGQTRASTGQRSAKKEVLQIGQPREYLPDPKLGILFWGPYKRECTVLGPLGDPPIVESSQIIRLTNRGGLMGLPD